MLHTIPARADSEGEGQPHGVLSHRNGKWHALIRKEREVRCRAEESRMRIMSSETRVAFVQLCITCLMPLYTKGKTVNKMCAMFCYCVVVAFSCCCGHTLHKKQCNKGRFCLTYIVTNQDIQTVGKAWGQEPEAGGHTASLS